MYNTWAEKEATVVPVDLKNLLFYKYFVFVFFFLMRKIFVKKGKFFRWNFTNNERAETDQDEKYRKSAIFKGGGNRSKIH